MSLIKKPHERQSSPDPSPIGLDDSPLLYDYINKQLSDRLKKFQTEMEAFFRELFQLIESDESTLLVETLMPDLDLVVSDQIADLVKNTL